jgi:mannitol/fructose-specific phosphotransferase system IIA component (Ntr-type)
MSLDLLTSSVVLRSLADYTRPALIVPTLRDHDAAGVIGELSQALQKEGCIADILPFYQAALNQELLSGSAQECGIAFPHARLAGVKHLQFAFGRAPRPLVWRAKGSWPVQLIFLVAVPATDATAYLHLLAALAKLGQQPESLAELVAAEDPRLIWSIFQRIGMRRR